MKSSYNRSKTIICKTTKNYYPHADDLLLLKICRHISIEALKIIPGVQQLTSKLIINKNQQLLISFFNGLTGRAKIFENQRKKGNAMKTMRGVVAEVKTKMC